MYLHIFNKDGFLNVFKSISNDYIIGASYQNGIYLDQEDFKDIPIELLSRGYIKDNLLKIIPDRPSNEFSHLYSFSIAEDSWIIFPENISKLKEILLLKVNDTRSSLSLRPILYDNKPLDADTQAQANINGKLQEIFAREVINSPLTSGEMFWKDVNNTIHSWSTQENYKLWLQGLVIAISSRNTSLYATAWEKKAEVEALTNITDILNYDVNSNWS